MANALKAFNKLFLAVVAVSVLCAAKPALDAATEFNQMLQAALQKRGVKDLDLRIAAQNEELIATLADSVVAFKKQSEEQRKLEALIAAENDSSHYRVYVDYKDIPSFAELKKQYPSMYTSHIWDGTKYKLETHPSCLNAGEHPGEKEFWVRSFGKPMTSDQVIAEADKDGFRPATFKEALAFDQVHPEVALRTRLIVLGSFAVGGGYRGVPQNLIVRDRGRGLGSYWCDGEWGDGNRFLLVRK